MSLWFKAELEFWDTDTPSIIGPRQWVVFLALRALERVRKGRLGSELECSHLRQYRGSIVSLDGLVPKTGYSRDSIRRAIDELERLGWVRRIELARGGKVARGHFVAIGPAGGELYAKQWIRARSVEKNDDLRSIPATSDGRSEIDPCYLSDDLRSIPATSDDSKVVGIIDAKSIFPRSDQIDRSEDRSVPLPLWEHSGDVPFGTTREDQDAVIKRSFGSQFPDDWQPPIGEDECAPPIEKPKRIDRLAPIEKPPAVKRSKNRQRDLLESAQRKWKEQREAEYTGDEAVAAWCYRYERELGFPDPELQTEKSRKQIAALFVRRSTEWAAGDRAMLLRYVRETFAWWVESNKRGDKFPGGLPSYAKLLRVKNDGTVSWFWGNWRTGGIAARSKRG